MHQGQASNYELLLSALPEIPHVSVEVSPLHVLRLANAHLGESDYKLLLVEVRALLPLCVRPNNYIRTSHWPEPISLTGQHFVQLRALLMSDTDTTEMDTALHTFKKSLYEVIETGNPLYATRVADDYLLQACYSSSAETQQPFETLVAYAIGCLLAFRHSGLTREKGVSRFQSLTDSLLKAHTIA